MENSVYAAQIEKANEQNPFMKHNGIRATWLDERQARVEAQIGPSSLNAMGSVHGGLMMAAAEIACGLLVRSDGRKYVTLDSSFRFLRPGTAERIEARAEQIKSGRTVSFARAQVIEPDTGRLLAEGEFTFYCLD